MKTVMSGALALILMAQAAPAAMAQDNNRDRHDWRGPRPAPSEAPQAPRAAPTPQAQPAPQAPQAAQGQPGGWNRDRGGRGQPNGDRNGDRGRDRGGDRGQGGGQNFGQPNGGNPNANGGRTWTPPAGGQPSAQPNGQRNDHRWNDTPPAGRDDRDRGDNRGRDGRDDHDRGNDGRDNRWNNGGGYNGYNGYGGGYGGYGGYSGDRDGNRSRPNYDRNRYPPRYNSPQRYRGWDYRPPSGFYMRNWGFGDILPRGWWTPDYRLNNWWDYGLPIPPAGYEWVRVGDNALLVDMWSGRVVEVVYDLFW